MVTKANNNSDNNRQLTVQNNSGALDGETKIDILKKNKVRVTLAPQKCHKTEYTLKDFSHLGHKVDYIKRQLELALEDRTDTKLFVIKGPRKSGRTEFIKALHQALGFDLFIESWQIPFGNAADRKSRINDLIDRQYKLSEMELKNTVLCIDNFSIRDLSRYKDAILLRQFVDELTSSAVPIVLITDKQTDFINSYSRILPDKSGMNKLQVSVSLRPSVIAVADMVESFDDPAFIALLKPLNDNDIFLDEKIVRDLSQKYSFTEDLVIHEAIKSVLSLGPDQVTHQDLEVAFKGVASIFHGDEKVISSKSNVLKNKDLEDYEVDLVNIIDTDVDLRDVTQAIIEEVEEKGTPNIGFRFNLLGPSGTGKTAFAKKLAAKIGCNVIETGLSELNSKFRGEPAKRIEAVFQRAQKEKATLIINEADPLMYPRHSVSEVSGSVVSAFLEICERYPDVNIVLTSNMIDQVDDAIKRRFPISIKYDYLTREQSIKAFQYFFNIDLQEKISDLAKLPKNLTPGDFAGLRNKIRFSIPKSKQKERLTPRYYYNNIIKVARDKGDTETYKKSYRVSKCDKLIGFGSNEPIEVGTTWHTLSPE